MFEQTWPVYAGYVCSTHVGQRVRVGDIRGTLMELRVNTRHSTVMLLIRRYEDGQHVTLRVDPRTVVYSDD